MITLRNTSTVDDYVIHSNGKCLSRKKVSLSVSGSNLTFNGVYNLLSSIYKGFVSNLWANYDVNYYSSYYCQSYSANLVNSNFLELIPPLKFDCFIKSQNNRVVNLLTIRLTKFGKRNYFGLKNPHFGRQHSKKNLNVLAFPWLTNLTRCLQKSFHKHFQRNDVVQFCKILSILCIFCWEKHTHKTCRESPCHY